MHNVISVAQLGLDHAFSPQIASISSNIVNQTVRCRADEATALASAEAALLQAAAEVEAAFTVAQNTLEVATGSTLSSPELSSIDTVSIKTECTISTETPGEQSTSSATETEIQTATITTFMTKGGLILG